MSKTKPIAPATTDAAFTGTLSEPVPGPEITMTIEQWHAVPNNPRQRNTADRAQRAKHLRVSHPSHQRVAAARLPDDTMIKLDGHTRDYLWTNKMLDPPETGLVTVTQWLVADIAQAAELYTTYDNVAASENLRDRLYGARNEIALQFQSPVLAHGDFGNGLTIAHNLIYGTSGVIDVYTALPKWRGELMLLDGCNPSRDKFVVPVIAGALLILRFDPQNAVNFLSDYQADAGTKTATDMDAVEAFNKLRSTMRGDTIKKNYASQQKTRFIRLMVSAFLTYRDGGGYKVGEGIRDWAVGFERWINRIKKLPAVGDIGEN